MVIDSVRLVRTEHDLVASFDADVDLLESMFARLTPGQWVYYRRELIGPRERAGVVQSFSLARDAHHAYMTIHPWSVDQHGPVPINEAPLWSNWVPWMLRLTSERDGVTIEFVRKEPA